MPAWFCRWMPWLCPPPAAKPPPAPPAPVPAPDGSLQGEWLAALNRERAAYGLPPMATDPLLAESAQSWAETMARSGILDHGDFFGRITAILPDTAAAEDIAEGQPDVRAVVAAWMSSTPHRRNVLGDYNRTGIGRAVSPSGLTYWVSDFDMIK